MKHKDVSKKGFSRAAVFFTICVVCLLLTGWGLSSSSTKANNLRVTNQTTAFHVESAEVIGDRLKLSLRNVSEKTINGYRLVFNRSLLTTDYTIGSFAVAPGQIEEFTYLAIQTSVHKDDDSVARMAKEMLQIEGWEVDTCADGSAALEKICRTYSL